MKILGTFEEVHELLSELDDRFRASCEDLTRPVSESTRRTEEFVYDTGMTHRFYSISCYASTRVPRTLEGWEGGVWMSASNSYNDRPNRIVDVKFEKELNIKSPFFTMLGFVLNDIMTETKEVTNGDDKA